MIPNIEISPGRNIPNPFSSPEPIRLTLHTEALKGLTGIEAEAYDALRELSNLPDIDVLQTEPGEFPHFDVGEYSLDLQGFHLDINRSSGKLSTRVPFPYMPDRIIERFDDEGAESKDNLIEQLVLACASSRFQHIFVTASEILLEHPDDVFIKGSNPRTPLEAAKIVGLFLRSRGKYTYSVRGKIPSSMDRWMFYWILTREHLPSMWRYFHACVDAGLAQKNLNTSDDTLEIGQSILTRAVRALQARDEIGIEFYGLEDKGDEILYHFDYLTLLLTGIFDAQALIAYRAFVLSKPKAERDAKFQIKEFRDVLKNSPNTTKLSTIIENDYVELNPLLHKLRNTIHGAGLAAYTRSHTISKIEQVLISVPNQYHSELKKAAMKFGSLEDWGLIQYRNDVSIEPYTYSCFLIKICFELINKIADATDVVGLFPNGHPIPTLETKPPQDEEIWSEKTRTRIAVLG
jgi:hypothetical protein